jgi:PAS domain S-box-containing protein
VGALSTLPLNSSVSIEAEFQFLADFIPQLVWITDPTGFHLYFNQRWIDYTGYTLADSVGPDMWNNLLHPDDRTRARQIWGHSLATGENYEIEYRFKSKTGGFWDKPARGATKKAPSLRGLAPAPTSMTRSWLLSNCSSASRIL